MIADILGTFPQISLHQILYEFDVKELALWFNMSVYKTHRISIKGETKHDTRSERVEYERTHIHESKGWRKRTDAEQKLFDEIYYFCDEDYKWKPKEV